MTDRTLKEELSALLDSRRTALSDALKVKGINDRVDSLPSFAVSFFARPPFALWTGRSFTSRDGATRGWRRRNLTQFSATP